MTDAVLPLDRAAHHALAVAVLSLPGDRLDLADYQQIQLQLDHHVHVIAAEVHDRCAARVCPDPARQRVEHAVAQVLRTTGHPAPGTLAGARNSARAVVALHTCLDHLANAPSAPHPVSGAGPDTGPEPAGDH
ncbi:restriction endonuclease [Streptomyces sp. IBSNAI002]|uniref:restriction endonuclease n=1 Tax=Streptomyces sp. IBSNAI002 TaxID=3457500 RepID=UPI003FD17296